LAKDCYSMKMDLLTNAAVVDDAIRFVSKSTGNLKSSTDSDEDDKEESNEPDYDEDKDQLEEEQEEETGEIASVTTNQGFLSL
jgi:Sec-independent protein translocase protein TatA